MEQLIEDKEEKKYVNLTTQPQQIYVLVGELLLLWTHSFKAAPLQHKKQESSSQVVLPSFSD